MGVARLSRSLRMAVALIGCLAWGGMAVPVVVAAEPPEYEKSFGPDGTEASGFGRAAAIAVDEGADVVYVIGRQAGELTKGTLFKFDLEGNPVDFGGAAPYISGNEITGLTLFSGNGKTQVAVDQDSHDFYVTSGNSIKAFHPDGEETEFTAGPGEGTNSIGGFGQLTGLAVDVNGAIYASDNTNSIVKIYSQDGKPITQFSDGSIVGPANLAVDTNGNVYVNRWKIEVLKYIPSAFPVTGSTAYSTVESEPVDLGSHSVAVDPTNNDLYVTHNLTDPGIVRYDENGKLLAAFAGPGEKGELFLSEGVAAIDGEEGRVFATNAPSEGLSQVEIFPYQQYVGPPLVGAAYASEVTSDSAVLNAQINPGSFEATYWFEYGPADCSVNVCASIPLGGESIGDGDSLVAVSQAISGLQPGTAYHYRVVAGNEKGSEVGPESGDHVFTTQTDVLDFQLSDSRAWEMVSPPNKHGGVLLGNWPGLIQASEDGNALAYLSKGPVLAATGGNRSLEPSTTLARRSASGWSSEDVMPPNEQVTPIPLGMQGEYKLFSPNLERALLEPLSGTPLSPEASERTPYVRENTDPPLYTPLVTGKEGFANVPPGTEFGGDAAFPKVRVAGATPSLEYVVVRSPVPLSGPEDPAGSLYEWTAGQLRPVNVLPSAEGGGMIAANNLVGSGSGSQKHAISDDGSRVFWSTGFYSLATGNSLTALYMRDTAAEETVRLDVVQPGASGAGTPRPTFQGANPEGTVVFFTDSQQLTEDASPAGFDLYRCEIPAGSPVSGCSTLTNITAPLEGSGESSEVQGILAGISEDGSTVYFVAKGVLDENPNAEGDTATVGEPNLYAWSGSGVRFIARLAPEDSQSWGVFNGSAGVTPVLNAGSSPSGRYLAFMSQRSLTGYDNRDIASGEPAQEVFRYDGVEDRLDCASCNPSSGVPVAYFDSEYDAEPPLIDPRELWNERLLAAVLPQPSIIEVGNLSLYRPRFMLDNGRVFFNAFDSLVSGDSNGEWDIYQYEPTGVGGCSASSGDAGTAKTAGGCVSLMSSGTAKEEAALLDTSATGDDVFFLTSARLAVTDVDDELDVYDARVDGVTAVKPPVTECSGESCRPLVVSPAQVSPHGSAAFNGPGNLEEGKPGKTCPKGKRKVRQGGKVRCVPRKHRKQKKHQQAGSGKGRGR